MASARSSRQSGGRAGRRRAARRRGRLRLTVVLVVLVLAGAWLVPRVAHATDERDSFSSPVYVVRQGDTLWRIAEELSGESHDLRAVVHVIREMNDLSSVTLQPGQRLLLPELEE